MNDSFNIRAAKVADAPAMGYLMVATFLAAHKGQIPEGQWHKRKTEWTPEKSAAGWAESLQEIAASKSSNECIFVADTAGELVGLVMGGPAYGEKWAGAADIYALYIATDWQGKGVGRELLNTAVSHLAQLGHTNLIIRCLSTNTPAQGFYEALGGKKVGEVETEDSGYKQIEWVYAWENLRPFMPT